MRPRLIRIGGMVVGLLLGASSAANAAQTHIVQSGETLWTIAARYHLTIDVLVSANEIADPNVLHLRQRLVIPERSALPGVRSTSSRTDVGRSAIPSRGSAWASALTARAIGLVGTRYRWGGTTPSGFDCSGFVNYVMGLMGVRVPRTTYAMYDGGRWVAKSSLQIGDIVFFQTVRPGPSHTGIYLGNHTFIQSSSASGRVTVTSLDDRYYAPRYLGARRFH